MGRDSMPSRSHVRSGSPQLMLMRRSLLSAAAASHSVSRAALLGLGFGVSGRSSIRGCRGRDSLVWLDSKEYT